MSVILGFKNILFHLQKKKWVQETYEITKNPNSIESNSRSNNITEKIW